MTNSRRLKRTFSHAIKSSSGDCELRETHKSPGLWLQFLPPAQNDLGHWVTGILRSLSGWGTGCAGCCLVIQVHLLGQFRPLQNSESAFEHLLALRYTGWTGAGDVSPSPGMQDQHSRKDPWASSFIAGKRRAAGSCVPKGTFGGPALLLGTQKLFICLHGRAQLTNTSIARTWQGDPGPGHGLPWSKNTSDELSTGRDPGMWTSVND